MSKPIEPGCLARVILAPLCPDLVGQEVMVIEWVEPRGNFTEIGGKPCWLNWDFGCWHAEEPGGGSGLFMPMQLVRVDGDDHVTTEEREDVGVPV